MPRYLQVASALRRRIRDGRWAVGERIATLEELEREFGVARVTVRQAIDLLQGEGLVKSFQGRGTFVTRASEADRWLQLATDWESLIAPIRDNVPQLLPSEPQPRPGSRTGDGVPGAGLCVPPQHPEAGRKPYAYARVHVARHIHARAPKPFSTRVALAVLSEMKGLGIARAHQTVAVGAADLETARAPGDGVERPDGGGALRRHGQRGRGDLRRRDHLSRRLCDASTSS